MERKIIRDNLFLRRKAGQATRADWKKQSRVFTDRTAQIIQHEIDHTNGILI